VLRAAGLARRAAAFGLEGTGALTTSAAATRAAPPAAPRLFAASPPPLWARGLASTSGGGGDDAFHRKCDETACEEPEPAAVFVRQLQEVGACTPLAARGATPRRRKRSASRPTHPPPPQAGEEGDLRRVFDLVEARGQDIDEAGVEAALAQARRGAPRWPACAR
jgi:hypothetical protein